MRLHFAYMQIGDDDVGCVFLDDGDVVKKLLVGRACHITHTQLTLFEFTCMRFYVCVSKDVRRWRFQNCSIRDVGMCGIAKKLL